MVAIGFVWFLVAAMAVVIWIDTVRYIIPNWLNLSILLAWVAGAFLLPVDAPMALAAAAIILVVGLGLFGMGVMGGGDIKLLFVLSLWTGWGIATVQLVVLTSLSGGLLVGVLLLLRAFAAQMAGERTLPRFLQRKQPVPYGIAIAMAFLWMLWRGMVPPLA